MLKNISKLEHKIGERSFQLLCDLDTPINEVKDALFEFLKFIGKIEDNAKAQQEKPVENEINKENIEEVTNVESGK